MFESFALAVPQWWILTVNRVTANWHTVTRHHFHSYSAGRFGISQGVKQRAVLKNLRIKYFFSIPPDERALGGAGVNGD